MNELVMNAPIKSVPEHGEEDVDICKQSPPLSNIAAWVQIYVGVCIAILSAVGGSFVTKFVIKKKNKIGRNVQEVNVQYKAEDQ